MAIRQSFEDYGVRPEDYSNDESQVFVNLAKSRWEHVSNLRPRRGIQFEYAFTYPAILEPMAEGIGGLVVKNYPTMEDFLNNPVYIFSLTRVSTEVDLVWAEIECTILKEFELVSGRTNPFERQFKDVVVGQTRADELLRRMIDAYHRIKLR